VSYWILLHLQAEAMSLRIPPEPFTPSFSWPQLRAVLILLLAINGAFFWRLRQRVLRVVGAAGEARTIYRYSRKSFPAGA